MPEDTDDIRHANSGEIWKYSWTVKDTPIWREVKIKEISNDTVTVINKSSTTEFNGDEKVISISGKIWEKVEPSKGGRSKTRKNKKNLKKRKNKSRKYLRKSYRRK